jgi:transcriptional regulator of acetoin/glycerol metabolism
LDCFFVVNLKKSLMVIKIFGLIEEEPRRNRGDKNMFEYEPWYSTESKQRCREMGLDPTEIPTEYTYLEAITLECQKEANQDLLNIIKKLVPESVQEIPCLMIVSDNKGFVLEVFGNQSIQRTLRLVGIKEGVQYTEEISGTNSISLAIRYNIPIQLDSQDHFYEFFYGSVWYSVPINIEGKLVATVSIMTFQKYHDPILFGFLAGMGYSIEQLLKMKESA